PIGAEHDRLAVEQGVLHGQAPHRLGDPRQPVGETRAVTAPQRDSLALLPGDDPIAVMFHLIPPVRPRWRAIDKARLTRANEASRRAAPGTRRRVRHNMPGHIMAFRGRRASLRWKAVNE